MLLSHSNLGSVLFLRCLPAWGSCPICSMGEMMGAPKAAALLDLLLLPGAFSRIFNTCHFDLNAFRWAC